MAAAGNCQLCWQVSGRHRGAGIICPPGHRACGGGSGAGSGNAAVAIRPAGAGMGCQPCAVLGGIQRWRRRVCVQHGYNSHGDRGGGNGGRWRRQQRARQPEAAGGGADSAGVVVLMYSLSFISQTLFMPTDAVVDNNVMVGNGALASRNVVAGRDVVASSRIVAANFYGGAFDR